MFKVLNYYTAAISI